MAQAWVGLVALFSKLSVYMDLVLILDGCNIGSISVLVWFGVWLTCSYCLFVVIAAVHV